MQIKRENYTMTERSSGRMSNKQEKVMDKATTRKVLFCNIRGLGGKSKRGQLKELVDKKKIDIIFLQETLKANFTSVQLKSFVRGQKFSWHWTIAQGHLGGTLVGVRQGDMELGGKDERKYFSSMTVTNKQDM
jgi:exonuclease III